MSDTSLPFDSGDLKDTDEQIAALWEAAVLEGGGRVINEHYSLDEYVKRRTNFLSEHGEWKHHKLGLFESVRETAQQIFTSAGERLSAQEVQRREIASGEVPLLPLPTTANTQTLDAFQAYPKTEWTASTASLPETTANGKKPAKPHTARITKIAAQSKPTAKVSHFIFSTLAKPSQPLPSLHNIMSNQNSGQVSGRAEEIGTTEDVLPERTLSDVEKVREVVAALGRPGWRSRSNRPEQAKSAADQVRKESKMSENVMVRAGVSALANRAMTVPIKYKGKRTVPQEPVAEEGFDADDTEEQISDQEARPAKRVKVAGPTTKSSRATTTRQKRGTAKKSSKSTEPQSESTSLEGVISGEELPRNQDDAFEAAKLRHTRLLASFETERKSGKLKKKTSKNQRQSPDFPPEFFTVENYEKGSEEDSVRCACGVWHNDDKGMIQCNGCQAWQHLDSCMGVGVPADLDKPGTRYYCHVCDPWTHRQLIAELRRRRPLK